MIRTKHDSRIQVRVDRLVHGNPGSHRNLTAGKAELMIDFGPGYRVYYTLRGTRLILLLAGGEKSTQQRDIQDGHSLGRKLSGVAGYAHDYPEEGSRSES
ncbi:MAG: type II toxin-antitoxin system RelE/ParE family toxin [Betaproteobacteria bacterium]|nr:MAG: type II toxin-antitoxin system RelE/ParE family toxin [Betaproteobacteria bacterium]